MRLHAVGIGICISLLGCVCVGSTALPTVSVDGMWAAPSDAQGGALMIVLATRNTLVTGTGTYSMGAIRTGSLTITGTYRQPVLTLRLSYDNGETLHFDGAVVDSEHLSGQLSHRGGSVVPIKFVRP
jgi:hypothetical protein